MRFIAAILFCASIWAQESVTKLIELNNVRANAVENLIGAFNVQVRLGPDPRFVTLRGSKESVELAEQALKRIDRPKKNVEVMFQILAATKEPNNSEKLGPELAAVTKQLKTAFIYQGFRLVETTQLRTREGNGAEGTSNIHVPGDDTPNGTLQVRFQNVSVNAAEKPAVIHLDNLRFNTRMPYQIKTGFQFVDSAISSDIDVKEGQTAVVGRANLDGKEGAYFLVVNIKVLD